MAVPADVTVAENGGQGNVKLHPYLITLVRWCVSCLWSTATVLLHRLMTAQLPQIAASKPPPKTLKARAAGTEHLHPEPRVECVVLHQPDTHALDVIFVHGLYGSLGNTWRQGDWKSKYKVDPNIVPLRDHGTSSCDCPQNENTNNENICKLNENYTYRRDINESEVTFENINEKLKKILPKENMLITEKFYNNTLLDNDIETYETQANFVRDLFEQENKSEMDCGDEKKLKSSEANECVCRMKESKCEVGCGCVCDECYSTCWPRDWIKVDFPGARVISINYTSDPYLWRPLWVRGNKRLRLHERAEQMTAQLLKMGVGQKPIVWVGHSKGGLFIKQIYCEAYEAHLKLNQNNTKDNNNKDNSQTDDNNQVFTVDKVANSTTRENSDCDKDIARTDIDDSEVKQIVKNEDDADSSNNEEETHHARAGLWTKSVAFMFYSVPHRGSPLADIKTPITARSIELLEISKDCALVLSLQARWTRACEGAGAGAGAGARPLVRSLVETGRTLMSVLWLRIVSVDSADAGIGSLSGVSVDHREICKPSSRSCRLYTELTDLIRAALYKCGCR